jgi:hypothetical protein
LLGVDEALSFYEFRSGFVRGILGAFHAEKTGTKGIGYHHGVFAHRLALLIFFSLV